MSSKNIVSLCYLHEKYPKGIHENILSQVKFFKQTFSEPKFNISLQYCIFFVNDTIENTLQVL